MGIRIASLLPGATEIVCALGLRDHLVAVSHECDYPADVQNLPRATASNLPARAKSQRAIDQAVREAAREERALYDVRADVLERTQPDVIITQGLCDVCAVSGPTVASTLAFDLSPAVAKARVAALTGGNFQGIVKDILTIGELTGVPKRAEALVTKLQERWFSLTELTVVEPLPHMLVLEWVDPPFSAGHWVPEMIEQAGALSALGERGHPSRTLTWDDVHAADPDIILVAACGYGLADNERFARRLRERPETRKLRAIKDRELWAMDANAHFSRPGPRIVEGAEVLNKILRNGRPDPMREARLV